ncbi:hypothetical protein KIH77_08860 [Bifidobacterium sp. 82T24]|uniref:hypothetical protein n=1 Tax=Bifidobacterium pluvialisilvae TaxID=2834436 RepID=UPI001C5969AA|nr:hypothetical protein [Bifidobacterium pluvialisilvae]MBW3088830.1 hypothetical protein [Bifidobacterium pluvialisilvae]
MNITISRPTADVDVCTDLDALRQAILTADEINNLPPAANGMTEAEAAQTVRKRDELTARLNELGAKVRESSLTLTLRGLNSSQWNQIVAASTKSVDGKIVKDFQQLLTLALPRMLDHATWRGETTDIDAERLADELSDSQTMQLLETIQQLNTPATSLPKAVSELLNSPTA